MSTELKVFDPLKANVTLMVSPVLKMLVTDFASGAAAIEARKQVKALRKQVDDQRDDLVRPLNERVKTVNAYAKEVMSPLDLADAYLAKQIDAFATKQEAIRQAELRKADEKRREDERLAQIERQRVESVLQAEQELELERIMKAEAKYGAGPEAEEDRRKLAETQALARAETEARLDREAIERQTFAQQERDEIKGQAVKGGRVKWEYDVLDLEQVPRMFLKVEVNHQMILAFAAQNAKTPGGPKIPGIEFRSSIAVSSNGYVPTAALTGPSGKRGFGDSILPDKVAEFQARREKLRAK